MKTLPFELSRQVAKGIEVLVTLRMRRRTVLKPNREGSKGHCHMQNQNRKYNCANAAKLGPKLDEMTAVRTNENDEEM